MASEIAVGLDIGTTSVKAVAVEPNGKVVARARIPHAAHSPTAEIFEHNAREAWVDGPRAALEALDVGDIGAIGIASLMPSFTAVDRDGMPITPGLLYGDHRGRSASDTPDPLNSGESRAMLEWTARAAPDAHGYWTAATVAGVALGGAPMIDMGTAVALSPLWNGEWDLDRLGKLGVRAHQLPPVVAPGAPGGMIRGGVQVGGIADAWAEATVAGADQAGDTLVICGTTLIVWCMVAGQPNVPGMWSLPHPLGELQMAAGASNAGGMFVNWARRTIAPGGAPPAPGVVPIWVPYLRGERTPINDPSLRASLHDLALDQEPSALIRAAYEASAFVARRLIDAASPATSRIIASGGGLYDPAWMQALADCTGRPVHVVAVPEGAALGAAWHARVGAGLDKLEDVGRWVRFGQHYEPDPAWLTPCQERYERWCQLAAAPDN